MRSLKKLRSLKYYPFVIISKSFGMRIQVFPSCTRHVHDCEAIYTRGNPRSDKTLFLLYQSTHIFIKRLFNHFSNRENFFSKYINSLNFSSCINLFKKLKIYLKSYKFNTIKDTISNRIIKHKHFVNIVEKLKIL